MADYKTKGIIEKIYEYDDSYSISVVNNLTFNLEKKYNANPKIGDKIEVITLNGAFGVVKGVNINDQQIFYKSDEELDQENKARKKEQEDKEKREFEKNKARLDEQYDNLPEVFKKRIDRFRRNNPDFRVKYEPYELFCCEEAIKIAKSCGTPELVEHYAQMSYTKQKLAVPNLSDGHSGNTFGIAIRLAYWYLKDSENVIAHHGALSTLVGSEAYGDIDVNEN